MTAPAVSVVIPTFNRADLLRKAITSSLAQSIVPEVVVLDDGSSDDTERMMRSEFHCFENRLALWLGLQRSTKDSVAHFHGLLVAQQGRAGLIGNLILRGWRGGGGFGGRGRFGSSSLNSDMAALPSKMAILVA